MNIIKILIFIIPFSTEMKWSHYDLDIYFKNSKISIKYYIQIVKWIRQKNKKKKKKNFILKIKKWYLYKNNKFFLYIIKVFLWFQ